MQSKYAGREATLSIVGKINIFSLFLLQFQILAVTFGAGEKTMRISKFPRRSAIFSFSLSNLTLDRKHSHRVFLFDHSSTKNSKYIIGYIYSLATANLLQQSKQKWEVVCSQWDFRIFGSRYLRIFAVAPFTVRHWYLHVCFKSQTPISNFDYCGIETYGYTEKLSYA